MVLFPSKSLVAMIALLPLPGSPLYDGNDARIVEQALNDLDHYIQAGVDSVLLENDFDIPYIKPPLSMEAVKLTIKICKEIRKRFDKPLGIQMLEAANETSLEIAYEAKLDYIRAEGYVYAHIGGAGLIEGTAGKIQRLKKKLGADNIKIFADVDKKHAAHSITKDLDITEEVMQAELYLVDGVVVTGKFTGIKPNKEDLEKVRSVTSLPIFIGSGMTKENIVDFFPLADAFIVGSTFRKDGKFLEQLDPKRLNDFMTTYKILKKTN